MKQYTDLLQTLADDTQLKSFFLTEEQKQNIFDAIADDPQYLLRNDSLTDAFFMDADFMSKCVSVAKQAHLDHLKAMEKLAKAKGKPAFEKDFIKSSVMALEENLNKYIEYRQSCYVQTRIEDEFANY